MKRINQNQVRMGDALFARVRQCVLRVLFVHPELDYHTNEIIRLSGVGTGAVQRELKQLTRAGLITSKQVGNQHRYQANMSAPIFQEIRSIVLKTFGLTDLLKDALRPLFEKIDAGFMFGSVASESDTAISDIDLMLIGHDLIYGDVFDVLASLEEKTGRKINPTIYTTSEWIRKRNEENHFVVSVMNKPKIFLIGNDDDLEKLR